MQLQPLHFHFLHEGPLHQSPYFLKKKRKNEKFFENFLENVLSYSEIYFGPPRTIWSLRKWKSKFFSSKNP